jgi:peroxiredoxin Q/BCP
MPVELRKRKAVEPAPAPPAKKKNPVAKAAAKIKEAISSPKASKASKSNGAAAAPKKVAVGDVITLEGFGGEIETNDGEKTTFKKLVDESKGGVVLFTYPKASTPGCECCYSSTIFRESLILTGLGTKQACLFRDSYAPLTATGYSIFGLSTDSPKANTSFKEKQMLPYALLCDPKATLIAAIGLKKSPSGTQRGVFVVDKTGKVLAAEPGSPAGTVEVVEKLVGEGAAPAVTEEKEEAKPASNGLNGAAPKPTEEDVAKAEVAADVADTAEKLDGKT